MTKIPEYSPVATDAEFERLMVDVEWLHDGIVREAAFVARGYVDSDGTMWGDTLPADLVVIIQLQSMPTSLVELLLTEVTLCTITTAATTMEPAIEFSSDGVSLYLEGLQSRNTSRIVAGRLFYRIVDRQHLGPMLRLVRPVSIPE